MIRIFNSGFAREEVKGTPKWIRVEKRDLKSHVDNPAAGEAYLQELTDYRPDGKKAERSIFRLDGTLSYREVYEYAADGHLTKLVTFDGTGRIAQVKDADGQELTNDPFGLPTRVDVIRTGDVLVMTTYGADGTILTRSEMREANGRRESTLIFNQNPVAQVTTIEQTDARDVEGNWTRKTIFERYGPAGPMEAVAEIRRAIIYY